MTKKEPLPAKRAAARRVKPEPQQQGHTVPSVGVTMASVEDAKLSMIADTLKRNFESVPMSKWEEPIMSALYSAFIVGQNSKLEGGEDKALENTPPDNNIGYDFIERIAQHFGVVAKTIGVRPADLKPKWMVFNTMKGETVLALMPTLPAGFADTLTKL